MNASVASQKIKKLHKEFKKIKESKNQYESNNFETRAN